MFRILLAYVFIFSSLYCFAQDKQEGDDYYGEKIFHYDNRVYKNNIKTVQIFESSFEMSAPILQLNSGQTLKLCFDDLEGGFKSYSYTIIHCSANWEPSNISSADYIKGFSDNQITDYKYSFNTIQQYTHYNVLFPNSYMSITKSGNYIIKVFEDGDQEKFVLSRRFYVVEQKITIDGNVKAATIVADRYSKHEVDFTINHPGYDITNPYGDLNVTVMQNNRPDNAVTKLKPLFLKDRQLVYDYDQDNVFNGGNEFRFLDIKSIRLWSSRVQKITYDSLKNHVYVIPDEKRSYLKYLFYQDINGRFLIKINEGNDSEREADYCYVHFFLPYNDPVTEGNLYVYGAMTDWTLTKKNKLKYNSKRFGYEGKLYLKQGYYNYEYVLLRDNENSADESFIEGNHFETEDEYSVFVYHRAMGFNYDQLIGIKQLNSQIK